MPNFIKESKGSLLSWLIFVVIQQCIVASASLWIFKLIEAISKGQEFFSYLILFLLSLSLPYLPGMMARFLVVKWQYKLIQSWNNQFVKRFSGQMNLWNDSKIRSEREPYLLSESSKILTEFSEYVYMTAASFLNVGLGILVLVIILDKVFLATYVVSILVAGVFFVKAKARQSQMAQNVQNNKASLINTLNFGWDNILISNNLNLNIWKSRFQNSFDSHRSSDQALQNMNVGVSVILAYITLIPTMALVIFRMYTHSADPVYLSSMVVLLPRFFNILNTSYDTLRFASLWPTHKARIGALTKSLELDEVTGVENRITWSKLSFERAGVRLPISSIDDILTHLDRPGRITVRGENGAGKSSLFISIKMRLKDLAFVLPAHHNLSFETKSNLSTGQRMRAYLHEVSKSDDSKVLLLDEWSSNLDDKNTGELSNILDDLATKRSVVEIVH